MTTINVHVETVELDLDDVVDEIRNLDGMDIMHVLYDICQELSGEEFADLADEMCSELSCYEKVILRLIPRLSDLGDGARILNAMNDKMKELSEEDS